MPAPNHERQQMESNPPTAKQLAYLRTLAERTGRTFAWPRTSRDASIEIGQLRAAEPDTRLERRIERHEVADAIASGPTDDAKVLNHEVEGFGSTATWSRRS
jgi:hypothetical protein